MIRFVPSLAAALLFTTTLGGAGLALAQQSPSSSSSQTSGQAAPTMHSQSQSPAQAQSSDTQPQPQPQEQNSASNSQASNSESSNSESSSAHHGAKSNKVEHIQQALDDHGANVSVDGVWGPKTKAAVKDFQQQHNIKATGRVDHATMAALDNKNQ